MGGYFHQTGRPRTSGGGVAIEGSPRARRNSKTPLSRLETVLTGITHQKAVVNPPVATAKPINQVASSLSSKISSTSAKS